MMKAPLGLLEQQVQAQRNYDSPPLHLWQPALSGNIAIRIDAGGNWHHENRIIERKSLVRLFASILRREEDSDYYLVTPHEKWRIEVELHPLMITDLNASQESGRPILAATLNTERQVQISEDNPLFLDPAAGGVAVLRLSHGLTALCTRSAWYRLVDMADTEEGVLVLRSGEFTLRLPAT